jgi:hypothetical protein
MSLMLATRPDDSCRLPDPRYIAEPRLPFANLAAS